MRSVKTSLLVEMRRDQGLLAVFLDQHGIILERHPRHDSLEGRPAKGVDIRQLVFVVVLALPHIRAFRVEFAQPCDINVQPRSHVDPPRIDDVQSLATFALSRPRVDVEQVFALHVGIIGRVQHDGLVVVIGEVEQGGVRDLGVDIPIPGHDL